MYLKEFHKTQSTQNDFMNSSINGMNNLFQTIYNIESQNNFSFYIDDIEIKCNRLFASFISPSITKNFQADRMMNSFTFHVDDFVKIIESYYNVILRTSLNSTSTNQQNFTKEEVKSKIQVKLKEIIQKTIQLKIESYISAQNQEESSMIDYLILLRIFKNLGNDNFVKKLDNSLNQYLHLTNQKESPVDVEEEILERIQTKQKIGINYSNEIQYIKNHFCEMNTDMLNELDQNLIETIITQKDFQIPDEDSFLYQILEMNQNNRIHFLPFVQFQNLSVKAIGIFLNEIDFHEVNRNLWNSIAPRLLNPIKVITNSSRYFEPMKFEYQNDHKFEGIINFLNNKCGGNSHLRGLIEITSSGEKLNHCYDLIDHNFKSHFCTNAGFDSYIQFDFKDLRILINKYVMKTLGVPIAKLISWEICGSNDQKRWNTLSNIRTNAWSGYDNVSVLQAQSNHFYRYIRVKLTGYNAAGSCDLNLTSIEFFGLTKPCRRNKYNQS